ncbi:aspartic peptidase domain-containing protein [Mycena sp. CBHHK59/15]|nr:aspartic peptidase domain-containing protein [Mycena sp. CBHHK59/15]
MTAQLALLFSTLFWFFLFALSTSASPLETPPQQDADRTENGLHLPIFRRESRGMRRRVGGTGSIGLGDFVDVTYSFLATVGGIQTPLDTGSSDLWVASDAVHGLYYAAAPLPQSSFASAGLDVRLLYGDSLTGTHAFGVIGTDAVSFAGLTVPNQYFAAINNTNANVLDTGSTGIFGLGFPLNSVIWNKIFRLQILLLLVTTTPFRPSAISFLKLWHTILSGPRQPALGRKRAASSAELTNAALAAPMFTVTLQRDTVDIGGTQVWLSLGELPASVQNSSLTWVPEYPIAWELFIDDVYLDGVRLPRSNLSASTIKLSALIDTAGLPWSWRYLIDLYPQGNSLLRGPADVVKVINAQLGGSASSFPCFTPHHARMFPVDPRDFISQAFDGEVTDCVANGQGYQYSWSLGDPFLKSVLASFYYGNITYPSHDPPRIGLLSTVPSDAGPFLQSALSKAAAQNGGELFATTEAAPTGVPAAEATSTGGVPTAVGKLHNGGGSAGVRQLHGGWVMAALVVRGSLCWCKANGRFCS